MQLIRYNTNRKSEWDRFIKDSRNGTLLFLRDYMDYHSDRFTDHSLMYYSDKGRLIAVLPANESTSTPAEGESTKILCSHQGLTYGGFIIGNDVRSEESGILFDTTIEYLRAAGFGYFYYKAVPTIYHRCPTQEEEYWLWRHGAILCGCNLSCSVMLQGEDIIPMERRRRRGIRKAQELGYKTEANGNLAEFWPIMEENLMTKYSAAPVHTLQEMQLLQTKLPDNIECYICRDGEGKAQAGAVIYIANRRVVHVQYAHATPRGKEDGALDMLYSTLMDHYRSLGFDYFDIGTSNEDGGRVLNANLIAQKEGFGGRGIVYKQYRITL